jgi:hypothetical protein
MNVHCCPHMSPPPVPHYYPGLEYPFEYYALICTYVLAVESAIHVF